MSVPAFCFLNLAAVGSATIAPGSPGGSTTFLEALHPATAVQDPTRPHLRAYSLDLSAQRLTLDLGATTALAVIALINANFTTVTIQGHASDTWGAPSYSQAITIGPSENDRYHHGHRPTVAVPFNYRYLSLSIPNQATTDGLNRFALGGIFAGALTLAPGDVRPGPDEEKMEAIKDIETADGRKIQRLVLDDPAWRYSATRVAESEAELAAWRTIDRRWSAAPGQAALVCLRDAYPAECYVARKIGSRWRHDTFLPEGPFELFEVTAG